MKKIRIGKDIVIRWTILTNGEAQSLEGRDLSILLTSPLGMKEPMDFEINGNVLNLTFKGTLQKCTGVYKLTLWENFGKDGQTAVDHCNPFALVPNTCCEEDEDSCSNLKTESVDLGTSDMQLNPVYGIYSEDIRYIKTLTQEQYDALENKDEKTLYIITA